MAVFVPPGWDLEYTRCYGFELEDIFAFGMRSVETKWKAAGYPIDEMPSDVYPFDLSMPHEERAQRAITLMRAGVAGEPVPNPDSSPEVQALLFDVIARSAHKDAVNGQPVTIQWRFEDAAPWYVRIDNGNSEAAQGLAPQPGPDARDVVAGLASTCRSAGATRAGRCCAESYGRTARCGRSGGCRGSSRADARGGQVPGCPHQEADRPRSRRRPPGRSRDRDR